MEKNKIVTLVVLILIVAGVIIGMRIIASSVKTNPADTTFASCLKDTGVKFYGAFWCPHCHEQEKALNLSRQELETIGLYIECSTPDGRSQTDICKENGIKSYPTWVFADGTVNSGELSLEELSIKSSCPLPAPEVE